MKTHCRGCKWKRLGFGEYGLLIFEYKCRHPGNIMEDKTPLRMKLYHPSVWDVNWKNDCKYFEKKCQ